MSDLANIAWQKSRKMGLPWLCCNNHGWTGYAGINVPITVHRLGLTTPVQTYIGLSPQTMGFLKDFKFSLIISWLFRRGGGGAEEGKEGHTF